MASTLLPAFGRSGRPVIPAREWVGPVNLNTAERLGWAQQWRDREAERKAAAEEAAAQAATAAAQREGENPREP